MRGSDEHQDSVHFPVSANPPTQCSLPISEVASQTGCLPASDSFIQCGLFSLSRSIAQTLYLLSSIEIDQTDPVFVNISYAFALSCPFNLNPEKWSWPWSSSKEIQASIVDSFQSQSILTTKDFFSNQYPLSDLYGISRLDATMNFLGELDDDEKASLASVKMTAGAATGGGLVALIATLCLCLVLSRKSKGQTPQDENQIVDEFDLQTEHSDEPGFCDEEDSVFDLQNGEDPSNSDAVFDWDRWKQCRIPGGDFGGEESF
jgi:hypothetical protein